jgi:hypothetical protein
VLSTPPSPAVRNHRIAVRLALETVSALHRIPQAMRRWYDVRSCPRNSYCSYASLKMFVAKKCPAMSRASWQSESAGLSRRQAAEDQ